MVNESQEKCQSVSYMCRNHTIRHLDGKTRDFREMTPMTVWCYAHDQMMSGCAWEWQERALKAEEALKKLARLADEVMKDLDKHGPGIVPHLIDTDDNDGEYLRRAIRSVLGEPKEVT